MAESTTLPRSIIDALPISKDIAFQLNAVEELLNNLKQELRMAERGGVIQLAKSFVVMHRLNDKFDAVSKKFGALYETYKTETIPDMLEIEGLKNIPLSEGFRVGTSLRVYASVKKDQQSAAFEWLKQMKLGSLIIRTINSSSLSSATKEMMEEKNIDPPDDVFSVMLARNTSVTKLK